jgi:hypothetical protein
MAEMDEEAAEVFGVFFDAVVEGFDVFLLEELEDAFFEDAAPPNFAFAGDDFDEGDFFVEGFLDDVVEGGFNLGAAVEDVVEVEDEFGHGVWVSGNGDGAGVEDGDGVAGEIVRVECEYVVDAVDHHAGHQTGIVGGFTFG